MPLVIPPRGPRRALPLRTAALAAAAFLAGSGAAPAQAPDWEGTFEGRVEPSRTVVVANHVNGVLETLRFAGGEQVEQGALLAVIDAAEFEIALRMAQAALAEAEAALQLAIDDAGRQTELTSRGTGSRVAAEQAEAGRRSASALRDLRRAEVDAARLALERARINAPISGVISPPMVSEGAFLETKAGTRLAEILVLDPVRVAYLVPYGQRNTALAAAGLRSPAELFERIELTLLLPSGEEYPHAGRPHFESAAIDPDTDTLVVWGRFPNPDRLLVPGLGVRVRATLRDEDG
ncbi:efflux RND transporter periplasmic adaptor subunit [Oceanicella sp. SM1341]|uniref:efflux RND transporter periplasmic adaptor subunit n=1 Tax=Oceanicella sp. SM1341 TaxID=1548889 RepID=UPI0013006127|nr:efflux RND transporter periplasmic adaptor subunit [Oceanicella sp. SM1341]